MEVIEERIRNRTRGGGANRSVGKRRPGFAEQVGKNGGGNLVSVTKPVKAGVWTVQNTRFSALVPPPRCLTVHPDQIRQLVPGEPVKLPETIHVFSTNDEPIGFVRVAILVTDDFS